ATGYPDANGCNKPLTFLSDDGATWESPATAQHIVQIEGYPNYANADINGMNVTLFEAGKFHLYFGDVRNPGKTFGATSDDGQTFKRDGSVLEAPLAVNDVKKLRLVDCDWYLMGLHVNGGKLYYALSEDSMKFGTPHELCAHIDDADRYIVAIGCVVDGSRVL